MENEIMKNTLLNEIIKELNLKEKIIAKVFDKLIIKVYKLGITFGYNNK